MDIVQKIFSVFLLLLILFGCGKERIIHLYSLDKSQCITAIYKGRFRYIINGKHNSIPESNFVKLDVENVDPLGEGIHICWKNDKYEWDVVVDKSKIIESKLDSVRFRFNTSLPEGEWGIPTEVKFKTDGCMVFSFYLMKLSPDKGGIVEIP